MDANNNMRGYCGYDCGACAARSEDPAVRQKLVDGWRKFFGHENYTAENVQCDGCKAGGLIADKSCEARPCAVERGVESCALCADFVCPKVGKLLGSEEGMLVFLNKRMQGVTREEFELCARQFCSMPALARIMAEAGKLPDWVKGEK